MKRKTLRVVLWLAVVLWMAVIFAFSAESGGASTETSDGVVDCVVEEMFGTSDRDVLDDSVRLKVSFYVRKAAHFLAFMTLGILSSAACRTDIMKTLPACAVSFGICVLYAVSDELHQTFVPGREGRLLDVGIDSAGALCGVLVFTALCAIATRVRRRRTKGTPCGVSTDDRGKV